MSPIHKAGNELCFIYLLIYYCTTLISRVNVLNENTVRSEGIQITLYFIISSISIVRHCCYYENMVCINSIVNAKQKQTYYECEPILKCEYDFNISGVSIREVLHFTFGTGSVVYSLSIEILRHLNVV